MNNITTLPSPKARCYRAQLFKRYVSGRQLPDKAIDLLDEAAAAVRMNKSSKPESLDVCERKIKQLQKERNQLLLKQRSENARAGQNNIADAELQKLAAQLHEEKKNEMSCKRKSREK